MIKVVLFSLLLFGGKAMAASSSGGAGFELRGTYGMYQTPKDMNSYYTNIISDWPTQPQPKVMGGDLIFQFDKMPIVLGVRYETFTANSATAPGPSTYGMYTLTNYNTSLKLSRTSILLGARQDMGSGFLGVLFSVGAIQSSTLTVTVSGTSNDNKGKVGGSYSAGVEGGFRFGVFELGAEVGYLSLNVTEFDDPQNNNQPISNNGTNLTANFGGVYGKAFVGLAF